MERYAQKALEVGAAVICFTDHIDVNKHYDTFKDFQFELRREEFNRVKDKYAAKVKFLYGFEIGEPHLHPDVMEKVYGEQPDMIIGSIHNPLDYLNIERNVTRREYEHIYNEFTRAMVERGGFDVLGHVDMLKKWHDDYVEDFDYVAETLRLCVEKGIVPEINTSSLRSGASSAMPSMKAIAHYAKCGGKFVTISSDSHTPDSLCYAFDRIYDGLPEGVSACYFEQRRIVKL